MNFFDLIRDRYSCKKYDPAKPVSDEQLQTILEAGRLAPTAKNLQGQHIYVVRSAEALAKLDTATPCRYGAPVALIVAYDKNNTFTLPGGAVISGPEDMAIVGTHLMLAAKAIGVESCWVNNYDPAVMKATMGLPENEEVVLVLDLGFPAEGAAPLANHFSRKDLTDTVSYL